MGSGFSEIVYKDALQLELKSKGIPFQREKQYAVVYKGQALNHKFYADFVIYNKIILEMKSVEAINDKHVAQCINYLKVSRCRLANFHKNLLDHRRIVL
ncbi:GxxExxY protein [Autumnicola musiva]|uniref:GxxExxY protein n=1 Tax=Autumnicola musiva TaxID=3075589 RepID=A0ABU3D4L3_9FLAO|nr:GxxExxY protein [Zunongwangia sp. F117]MDT0675978.1 GxxExxY protein [Zunongwangia sp. F117]